PGVGRHAELNRFVAEALARGGDHEAEMGLRGDPARRVRAYSAPLASETGEEGEEAAPGLLLVLLDVTELRRLESLRSDFAANVSHELRTPITNIKGYVETLLDAGVEDREQALNFLRTISRNADRLGAIVDDMLMLTRLERSGGVERLETQWHSARGVIEQAATELEAQLRAKNVELIIEAPDDAAAQLNEALMRQAIANLLAN